MLGNGPYLGTQFMNAGLFLLWGGKAGSLVYLGPSWFRGNGPNVLGNGPHLCTQFMNTQGYSYYGEVRLGHWFILAPTGLGNGPHVLVMGRICVR